MSRQLTFVNQILEVDQRRWTKGGEGLALCLVSNLVLIHQFASRFAAIQSLGGDIEGSLLTVVAIRRHL